MTREEAENLISHHIKASSNFAGSFVEYYKLNEPCLYELIKQYSGYGITPAEFLNNAVNELMAAHSPLAKLL